MKRMDIKELEITKEMYNRAKEVENLFKITQKLDCRTEKFKKLNNKWIELDEKFEEEVSDEFDTLEIVNEYERRERNAKTSLKTVDEKKIEDEKKMKRMERRKITHASAWAMSLLALPIAIISVCKGATPLLITRWLVVVVIVQLLHLLPEALKKKEVYNDEF